MFILNEDSKDYAKNCFNTVIDIGIDFKLQQNFREKIFDDSMKDKLFEMPYSSCDLETVLEKFKSDILPYCSNFGSTKFMGLPDAGNSIAGLSGTILSDFLQQNLINSTFCAPIATYMEIATIRWLREIVGYQNKKDIKNIWDVGGIITAGGTGSNSTAMLLARENHDKTTMKNGVRNPEDYKIILPKGIAHYSIKSSQMWLGMGNNIIEVPTIDYRYDLNELEKTLKENKGKVMCVVAYAGDSRGMTVDHFKQIHNVVKSVDENIWLHADACHGFCLGFSDKLKSKISGIELFDSISTDPHKVLMVPYAISALLVKNPEKFGLITTTSDLIMQEDYAFGQITPFIGAKAWMSLKLWFVFQNLGKQGISDIIEKRCEMANYLKNEIINSKHFVVLNDVDMNSVMFMYVKDKNNIDTEKTNNLNKKIKAKIDSDAMYYLHQFPIADDKGIIEKGKTVFPLRYVSGNDNISKTDIQNMLNYINKIGDEINE